MNTVYSVNGPFGMNELYEVFADEGGEEVRFVSETQHPDAVIAADKAGDYDKVDALRWREIVKEVKDVKDDEDHEYHNFSVVLAKFRDGAASLK